ncbi:MAG: hypothetical protein WA667_12930 [Candidatus Nitrosopolaris sp.]
MVHCTKISSNFSYPQLSYGGSTPLRLHSLKREDVDWSQYRIIFIAPEFTKYQQHAIGFKDVGIQLWELHRYNNGLLVFDEVKSPFTKEPITTIAKNNAVAKKVAEKIKVLYRRGSSGVG